jgi:hypothetical protein
MGIELLLQLSRVVLTTSSYRRDLAFCDEAGANPHHVKPLQCSEHLQVLLDVFTCWLTRVVLPQRGRPIS